MSEQTLTLTHSFSFSLFSVLFCFFFYSRCAEEDPLKKLKELLNSSEWPQLRSRAFRSVDKDHSGAIDQKELLTAVTEIYDGACASA